MFVFNLKFAPAVFAVLSILCAASCSGTSTQGLLDASFLSNSQGAATVLNPVNNAHFSREKQFLWTDMPNAFYYQLEISTNADFSGIVLRARTKSSRYTVTDADLVGVSSLAQQVYHLRVITGYGSKEVVSAATQFVLFDPEIVYVNVNSAVVPIYGNLGAPFKKIQDGINYAAFNGKKRVQVAAGTYNEALVLANGVSVYGGYNGADWPAPRDLVANLTQIANSISVRSIFADTDVVLAATVDGFTVTNTVAATTYLVDNKSSALILSNNIFTASGSPAVGIRNTNASPTITNNTLTAVLGTINISSSPTMTGNTLTCTGGGGGLTFLSNDASSPTISNNTISGPTGSGGYLIQFMNGSHATLTNNTITGGAVDMTAVRVVSGSSATITNNTIKGGLVGATTSTGIYISNSSAQVSGNTITGGDGTGLNTGVEILVGGGLISPTLSNNTVFGGPGTQNYGVKVTSTPGGTPRLSNNVIFAGSGLGTHYGVYGLGGDLQISNNTIGGGNAGTSVAIYMNGGSTFSIRNNIVFNQTNAGASLGTCIQEAAAGNNPTILDNNNFFGCPTLYQDSTLGAVNNICAATGNLRTAAACGGTALSTPTGSGNVSINNAGPLFASINGVDGNIATLSDNDWHLSSAAVNCNVRGGGLTIAGITLDRAGSTRTTGNPSGGCTPTNTGQTGWSMGAYESD